MTKKKEELLKELKSLKKHINELENSDFDQKKVIEALSESEAKYRLLFDAAPVGIGISDLEGNVLDANPNMQKMMGSTLEELRSIGVGVTYAEPDERMVLFKYLKENSIVRDWEVRLKRKDGTIYTSLLNVDMVELCGRKLLLTTARDITDRKHDEEMLRLLSSAVEGAPDGVQIVDMDGYIIYSNKAVERMYGFSCEEFKRKHVNEMNVDPNFAADVIIPSIIKSGCWVGELMVKHRNGLEFPIWLNTSLVKNSKNEPIAMVGIIRDITERKHIQEALELSNLKLEESNRMKELFTDIMHHDLLNPINVAHGYVELFLEDETNPLKKSQLETIKRNLLKGIELIDNATKFSKLESMENIEFEAIDLRKVVTEVVENLTPLAVKAKIRIENKLKDKMPARANKIIEDVFLNLISNAIKYAPQGKKIVVDGKDVKSSWMIRVMDFGAGIKDGDKKLVFERFQRGDKKGVKGSGLGLAIARKIVELHNGRIWVEDNPEGGAVFVVEIPKSEG